MASNCVFGITWARGLGITSAKTKEVLVLKLYVKFRRGWEDRGEQESMRE